VVTPGPVATGFLEVESGDGGRRSRLVPSLTPEAVADVAYEAHMAGQVVATPGLIAGFMRFGVKVLPQAWVAALVRTFAGSTPLRRDGA
jgi:short-subunit dehydrogenase